MYFLVYFVAYSVYSPPVGVETDRYNNYASWTWLCVNEVLRSMTDLTMTSVSTPSFTTQQAVLTLTCSIVVQHTYIHTYIHKYFIKMMTKRIKLTIRETIKSNVSLKLCTWHCCCQIIVVTVLLISLFICWFSTSTLTVTVCRLSQCATLHLT